MRRAFTWTALAAVPILWAATALAGTLPTRAFDYAVFGLSDVMIGSFARVDGGDVGCNLDLGSVWLRNRARVSGLVAADTVKLGPNSHAAGFFCRVVEGDVGVTCGHLTLPLDGGLQIVRVIPGVRDVKLPARSRQEGLAAGEYGKIRVGTKSRLTLAGGKYDVRSIDVTRGGQILCLAPCTLNVRDQVQLREESILTAPGALDARAIRVNVEGGGGRAAFRAEARSTVDATVYAPNGRIHLGTNGRFSGAFVGDSVEVLQRARVRSVPAP